MIIFFDTRPDWSSARVRPTPNQEFVAEMICVVWNCLLFNAVVFLALFLCLQIHNHFQRRRLLHSPAKPTSFVVPALMDWLNRGMDFGIVYFVCYLALSMYFTYLD